MTISPEYAEELGHQIDELEAENESLREALAAQPHNARWTVAAHNLGGVRSAREIGEAIVADIERVLAMEAAFLVSLAENGLPADMGELLVLGNAKHGIPPRLVQKAIKAALAAQPPAAPKRSYQDTIRCEVCDWPLADSWMDGCVPGNCSYRPENPAEQERIRKRRASLALASPQHSGEI